MSWSTASLHTNPTISRRCWLPPDTRWIKLNMDGARSSNDSNSCTGGMFRNSIAKWLCDFSMVVGKDSIFRIEAKAMLEGLRIAWEKGFRQLDVECDNAILVETILASGAASSRMMNYNLSICCLVEIGEFSFFIYRDLIMKLLIYRLNVRLMVEVV